MNLLILITFAFIGACFGSFIHVAISRFSSRQTTKSYLYSIVFTRSKCPICKSKLTSLQLMPILSWLLQKGQCSTCKTSIPAHYLYIELFFAGCFMLFVKCYGLTPYSLILMLLLVIFTILASIDFKYYLLPDCYIFLLLILGLGSAYFEIMKISFLQAVFNLFFSFVILWLPHFIYYSWRKKIGLGFGDIKLFTALSTFVTLPQIPLILLLACCMGLVMFMFQFVKTKENVSSHSVIAFGPCLLVACYSLLLI
ncbi:prepilin peptidase [Orbaceae bacterium ac157xtp]